MQFIERLFGLYPDAGNGLLELSLIAILLGAVALQLALSHSVKQDETRTGPHRR